MRRDYFAQLAQDALEALPKKFDSKEALHRAYVEYLNTFPEPSAFYRLGQTLPLDIDTFLDKADEGTKNTFMISMARFALKMYL